MRISLILFIFLTIGSAFAEQAGSKYSQIAKMQATVLKWLPAKYKQGVEEYSSMIGLKAYKNNGSERDNLGIIAFNEKILKNKCFNDLSEKFYEDLSLNLRSKKKSKNNLSVSTESAGSPVKSGWLWKEALKASNGDGNLAMSLLGICGHDNTMRGLAMCQGLGFEHSLFYKSGSLGKETIVSNNLKKRIVASHNPKNGASYIPSKYYHTIGGAYIACSLVRNGVPGLAVKKIQMTAANTYRMIRICDDADIYPSKDLHEVKQEIYLRGGMSGFLNLPIEKQFLVFSKKNISPVAKEVLEFSKNIKSKKIAEEKVRRFLTSKEASNFIVDKIMGGAEKCRSPQIFHSKINKIDALANETLCAPKDTYCSERKKVLKSYYNDFIWTEEQHKKGAEFAIKNCKEDPDFLKKDLEKSSCKALRKVRTQNPHVEDGGYRAID